MALLVKDIPNVDSLLFKSVANLREKSTRMVLMKHPITLDKVFKTERVIKVYQEFIVGLLYDITKMIMFNRCLL